MRILANENFPVAAVRALRERGHDVVWALEAMSGAGDVAVLEFAAKEQRLLVTFDKDFDELAFRWGMPAHCGIVLFRVLPRSPDHAVEITAAALASRSDWAGHFAVVEPGRIRVVPLPHSMRGP